MGYDPQVIPSVHKHTEFPSVDQQLHTLEKIRDEALATHELARQLVEQQVRKKFTPFRKGQEVWLEAKNLKLQYANRKLAPKRQGPFKITEVLGPVTYKLKLPVSWRIHPVFHANLLTPYHENNIHGPNYTMPPPDLVGGEEEYEIEAIINHRPYRNTRKYLIAWKGYGPSENSWMMERDLEHASELLQTYKKVHKL